MTAGKPLLICLMGPTASGKTDLAIELAEARNCELVSVDSALVYRGLDIGSAKPDYPHHLVDIRDPLDAYSAADFVADARAATPSAAAELLSPQAAEWLNALRGLEKTLQRNVLRHLRDKGTHLQGLRRRMRHPGDRLQEQSQALDELEQRLQKAARLGVSQRHQQLQVLLAHLQRLSPANRLAGHQLRLAHLHLRHNAGMVNRVAKLQHRLAQLGGLLHSLSPLATLERGYALVTNTDGELVTNSQQVAVGDVLNTKLASGVIVSEVRQRSAPA